MEPTPISSARHWAVIHRLHRVDFTLELPTTQTEGASSISAVGRSNTKRSALWTYAEEFDPVLSTEKGYEAHDAIAHIALACVQDRPTSAGQLKFALSGGVAWDEDTLF